MFHESRLAHSAHSLVSLLRFIANAPLQLDAECKDSHAYHTVQVALTPGSLTLICYSAPS